MQQVAFDVIVVGAGMAGTSVAAELSERCSVVLIERESHRCPCLHPPNEPCIPTVLRQQRGHRDEREHPGNLATTRDEC